MTSVWLRHVVMNLADAGERRRRRRPIAIMATNYKVVVGGHRVVINSSRNSWKGKLPLQRHLTLKSFHHEFQLQFEFIHHLIFFFVAAFLPADVARKNGFEKIKFQSFQSIIWIEWMI